jgi:hypothetical protein
MPALANRDLRTGENSSARKQLPFLEAANAPVLLSPHHDFRISGEEEFVLLVTCFLFSRHRLKILNLLIIISRHGVECCWGRVNGGGVLPCASYRRNVPFATRML